jgi:5-formyltetrahydrofolate cyclo-ligase
MFSADDAPPAKGTVRRNILAARRALSAPDRHRYGVDLAGQLIAWPGLPVSGGTVAAYVGRDDEPDTAPLIELLTGRGTTVLLPILLPDHDLGWAPYDRATMRTSRLGISEPVTATVPPAGITAADAVVCPGLAADLAGRRLGRGGGSYDRVLRRFARPEAACVLLYDTEVVDRIPIDDHDEPVGWLVTPTRLIPTEG